MSRSMPQVIISGVRQLSIIPSKHFRVATVCLCFRCRKSSAGHPPHALVTFDFGGKLIVMKDHSSFGNPSFESQNPVGGSISVLKLMDVVSERVDNSSLVIGACDYNRYTVRPRNMFK
ncbi:hypothetical protein P3L10_030203 [Capsicum annuum]